MRAISWIAMILLGGSFAMAPAVAAPLYSEAMSTTPKELSSVVQVDQKWNGNKHRSGNRKWKRRGDRHHSWRHNDRWRHNDHNNGFSFGFGLPLLGYGLNIYDDEPECYGRWHQHNSGRLHCHGRLVY
jgi:hypothetical protein